MSEKDIIEFREIDLKSCRFEGKILIEYSKKNEETGKWEKSKCESSWLQINNGRFIFPVWVDKKISEESDLVENTIYIEECYFDSKTERIDNVCKVLEEVMIGEDGKECKVEKCHPLEFGLNIDITKYLLTDEEIIDRLSYDIESLNEQRKVIYEKISQACMRLGLGKHWQAKDGTVYEINEPNGVWVPYVKIGYDRTRRGDERSGSLSLTRAQELGYEVESKVKKSNEKTK